MDSGVAPALVTQLLDVALPDRSRLVREVQGEVAKRAYARLEVRLLVVVRRVLRQLIRCALGTEVVCMRANSVMAVVRTRNDDRKQFPLDPGELGWAEHDRPVEIHRRSQHSRVERHRLDDVENLARAPDCGVVLLLQLARCLALVDQPQVRHSEILAQIPV